MFRFALTIFASAFLLFQVQPLIARFILPWFGGTPAVWSTCMLFFQMVLLAGYGYAHFVTHYLQVRTQAVVHMVVLLAACLMLPIIPSDSLRPTGEESPVFQILLVLTATIGLPYFVVSTTGPLLQAWFAKSNPGRSPYRLFALSNFGSLVALLTYPFVFEPLLPQRTQANSWSIGFGVFALLCGWCALRMYAFKSADHADQPASVETAPPKYTHEAKPTFWRLMMWIGLSMVPSILLLATTNQVCQEIAVVPFLWVIPLALYLVTFIICFEAPYLYIRAVFYPLFALSTILAVVCLHLGVSAPMWLQVVGLFAAFFFGSMVCHGELACDKPAPKYLTLFYLAVSVGGALGGVFVVLIAPIIFIGYFEMHVGLILAIWLTAIAFHSRSDNPFFKYIDYRLSAVAGGVLALAISAPVIHHYFSIEIVDEEAGESLVLRERDFYGILTVKKQNVGDEQEKLLLLNGRINHGNEFTKEEWQLLKTTYYCEGSGIGHAITKHPRRLARKSMKVGVIGLGTGTVAAWGNTGDEIVFYEINPTVVKAAEENFYYLRGAREKKGAKVDVILGDARIQLQRQLENKQLQKFDVLAVDAFSSDAIPRHLLTLECVQLYEKHLNEGGIIAIHISNRFLDLEGICHRIGTELKFRPRLVNLNEPEDFWGFSNTWVLLTRNEEFLDNNDVPSTAWDHDWYKRKLKEFVVENSGLSNDEIDLEKMTLTDLASELSKDNQKELRKKWDRWQLAERQFKVLWTDDFGSLWQVIKLEFDIADSIKEIKEWWNEDSEEEESEDDDSNESDDGNQSEDTDQDEGDQE